MNKVIKRFAAAGKRFLALAVVFAMLASLLPATVFAGGETVVTSKSGDDVTITVKNGTDEVATAYVTYEKNKTVTYDVGDYQVEIRYNGNDVNKTAIVGYTEPSEAPEPGEPKADESVSEASGPSGADPADEPGDEADVPAIEADAAAVQDADEPETEDESGFINDEPALIDEDGDSDASDGPADTVVPADADVASDEAVPFDADIPAANSAAAFAGANHSGGVLRINKTVKADGVSYGITDWLGANEAAIAEAVAGDIAFELYRSDKDGFLGDFAAAGALCGDAVVFWPKVETGWYLAREALGSIAENVFEAADDLLIYFVAEKPANFLGDFDYGAHYKVSNGYGSGYVIGYPGLNNNGDIFSIELRNESTDEYYTSFCANGSSQSFAGESGLNCTGYAAASDLEERMPNYPDVVSAYNYIEDNYGGVLAANNRALTQIVSWALIGAIDVESAAFDAINWAEESKYNNGESDKEAVLDVIANYSGYAGAGKVEALAFMICDTPGHTYGTCQPQFLPLFGKSGFTFTNTPKPADDTGILKIKKIVKDGELKLEIRTWLSNKSLDADEILGDIAFELYSSDEYGAKGGLAAVGALNGDSVVEFSPKVGAGWYLIHETLGPKAAAIFKAPKDQLVYFDAKNVVGASSGFDYESLYIIDNDGSGGAYTLGYTGLNNSGDIFKIGVRNADTGVKYASFCANAGSQSFAGQTELECEGYMVASQLDKVLPNYLAFLSAYNYIEDKYDGLTKDSNRALVQIVTWALLGAVDIDAPEFEAINWAGNGVLNNGESDMEAVRDVVRNSEGYAGEGKIIDLVYLECEIPNHSSITCQPQLVPVFDGDPVLVNRAVGGDQGLIVTADVKAWQDDTVVQKYQQRDYWNVIQRTYWDVKQREVWDVVQRETWDILQRKVYDVYQRDVWNTVQRDVWDIMQRDVWDIVQREFWNVVQRDTWDIVQREIRDIMQRDVWDKVRRDVWDIRERDVWDNVQRDVWDVMQRDVWDIVQRDAQDVMQRDVWDIVQRDVWDIMQRDVWDIVQRDVWDILQRDVWDNIQREVWDVTQRKIWDVVQRDVWDVKQRDVWDITQRDVWDIVQRDVWDILQRDTWDIVQRDVWDVMQRKTWDVKQRDVWDIVQRDVRDVIQRDVWDKMQRETWDIKQREVWDIVQREVWDKMQREAWDEVQRDVWDKLQREVWDIKQRDVWDIKQREVWDITQRDVWTEYECTVWDIFEREVWDILQRNVWDILQREIQPYVRPVFEIKQVSPGSGTLVTWRDNQTIPGGTFNNSMTYVEIDVEKARTEGYTFYIADSSPSNKKITPEYAYNVKIEGDELLVYFDDNFVSASVTAKVYADPPDKHDPSHHVDMKTGDVLKVALPAPSAGGTGKAVVNTSQTGNNVTVTVINGSETYSSVVQFEKNAKITYNISGYTVVIEYNGSKVKSAEITDQPATPPVGGGSLDKVYLFFHLADGITFMSEKDVAFKYWEPAGEDVGDYQKVDDGVGKYRKVDAGFGQYYYVGSGSSGGGNDGACCNPACECENCTGECGGMCCGVDDNGFDYDALYIVDTDFSLLHRLGHPNVNGSGEVFPINLVNKATGDSYVSFCANAGSESFAGGNLLECEGYVVAAKLGKSLANYEDFLSAYNYIEDNYGGLTKESNRALVQIVTWALLGAIDAYSPEYEAIDWTGNGIVNNGPSDKEAVRDVLGNSQGYAGSGKLTDLVYMVCEIPDHGLIDCQPQLVPLYGCKPIPCDECKVIEHEGDFYVVDKGHGEYEIVGEGSGKYKTVDKGANDYIKVGEHVGKYVKVGDGFGEYIKVGKGAGDYEKVGDGAGKYVKVDTGFGEYKKVGKGAGEYYKVGEQTGKYYKVGEDASEYKVVDTVFGEYEKVKKGSSDYYKVDTGFGKFKKVDEGSNDYYKVDDGYGPYEKVDEHIGEYYVVDQGYGEYEKVKKDATPYYYVETGYGEYKKVGEDSNDYHVVNREYGDYEKVDDGANDYYKVDTGYGDYEKVDDGATPYYFVEKGYGDYEVIDTEYSDYYKLDTGYGDYEKVEDGEGDYYVVDQGYGDYEIVGEDATDYYFVEKGYGEYEKVGEDASEYHKVDQGYGEYRKVDRKYTQYHKVDDGYGPYVKVDEGAGDYNYVETLYGPYKKLRQEKTEYKKVDVGYGDPEIVATKYGKYKVVDTKYGDYKKIKTEYGPYEELVQIQEIDYISTPVPYRGEVSLLVKDADGETVYDGAMPIAREPLAINGLKPGTYTLTLTWDEGSETKTALVEAKKYTSVDFDDIDVHYVGDMILLPIITLPDNKVDDVVKEDKKIADKFLPDKKIADVTLPDKKIGPVKLPDIKLDDKYLDDNWLEDEVLPDHQIDDVLLPDNKVDDVKLGDVQLPDEVKPDRQRPAKKLEDVRIPNLVLPDNEIDDEILPDNKIPDRFNPDNKIEDKILPDNVIPNVFNPDNKIDDEVLQDNIIPARYLDDVQVADEVLPDNKIDDVYNPDNKIADEVLPDNKIDDVYNPDNQIADKIMPDIKIDDVKLADRKVRDVKLSDRKIDDVLLPDNKIDDVQLPDVQLEDVKLPDNKVEDVQLPDNKVDSVKLDDKKVADVKRKDNKVAPLYLADKKVAAVKLPDNKLDDVKLPDNKLPDKKLKDNKTDPIYLKDKKVDAVYLEDVKIADKKLKDKKVDAVYLPDKKVKPVRLPDNKLEDVILKDKKVADVFLADNKIRDKKLPDLKVEDVQLPDNRLPDVHTDITLDPVYQDKKIAPEKLPDVKVADVYLPDVILKAIPLCVDCNETDYTHEHARLITK